MISPFLKPAEFSENPRNVAFESLDESGQYKLVERYDSDGNETSQITAVNGRFIKGHSGNRKGRPVGSRNVVTLLKEMFGAPVPVREGEKRTFMSRAEAMIRLTVKKGLAGDRRALSTLFGLLELTGRFDQSAKEASRPHISVMGGGGDETDDELEFLADGSRRAERQRYLAMADAEAAKIRESDPAQRKPEVSAS